MSGRLASGQFAKSERPQLERFLDKCEPEPNSGCWLWFGAPATTGYGMFCRPGSNRTGLAHRYAYLVLRGPIAEGLELDHLCRNRRCVNPQHLEAVPRRTNLLRGVGIVAVNARKTHCPLGHLYDGLYISPKGYRSRQCRECLRRRSSARYRRVLNAIGQSVRLYRPRLRPSQRLASSPGVPIPG